MFSQTLMEHKNYLYRISAILSTRALAEAQQFCRAPSFQVSSKDFIDKHLVPMAFTSAVRLPSQFRGGETQQRPGAQCALQCCEDDPGRSSFFFKTSLEIATEIATIYK